DNDHAEHQEAPLEQVLAQDLDAAQPLGDVGDQYPAQDRPGDVARTAHDHTGQDQDRELEHERAGVHETLVAGEHHAAEAGHAGADGKGPELELDTAYPHDLGGLLVLPDGQPGSADPATVEVTDRED